MSDAPTDPSEPEAPRREFRLKPAEFERVNRPAEEHGENAPIDVRQHLRRASGPPPRAVPTATRTENDVHGHLRTNAAQAESAGLNAVIPQPRRPSRRKRDYWLVLVGGNGLFASAAIFAHRDIVTLVFAFSGIILFSISLTWIMWVLLDDY